MEINLDLEIDRKQIGLILAGVILGAGLTLGYTSLVSNSQQSAAELVSFLENQTGQQLEVVNAEPAGQFHRVEVRTSQNQLTTYYTDGQQFTTAMQSIQQVRQRTTALADFSQCLSNSGTVVFGNTSQRATQTQIQNLGGVAVVRPIYRDVSNQTVLRQAVQLGVQRVPAFYRNQTVIQGVQTLQQVEQFTGCNYRLN